MEEGLTTTIRVSRRTRDMLQTLAEQSGRSVQVVLEEAVKFYGGRRLLEATNAAYAALRDDPVAWRELQEERAEWDVTVSDGLKGRKPVCEFLGLSTAIVSVHKICCTVRFYAIYAGFSIFRRCR